MEDFYYRCEDGNLTCAEECVGLDSCQQCECAMVSTDAGGPWGDVMDVIFCLFPIVFLIVVTVKNNPYPTTLSLPMAAGFMFLVRLMYLGSDPLLTSASVVLGLHEALTPLSIMAGAIVLFETMDATYCLPYMMREMKALTDGHPVAELMLIFCFAYMIEGASGFGTPVALSAPMLVSSGHSKLKSVVTLLVMNTFATVWGAVGTPIWFGFGGLIDEDDYVTVAYKAGICLAISAFLLLPVLLCIICPVDMVKQNILFVYLSLTTCVGPSLGLAFANYEFPSLIGGMIGCAGTATLITYRVGLASAEGFVPDGDNEEGEDTEEPHKDEPALEAAEPQPDDIETSAETPADAEAEECSPQEPTKKSSEDADVEAVLGPRKEGGAEYAKEFIMRTSPIWLVVVLLILTRVSQIGIKEQLTRKEPNFAIFLGTFGTFRLSASLVFQMNHILSYPGLNWKFELLYLPFMMPFVLVSLVIMFLYRHSSRRSPLQIFQTVAGRLRNPAIALFGALVLVQLLLKLDTSAPAYILGTVLSDWFKQGFIVITPLLGALGSFFSGSTTVSNLTFGTIQKLAAESIGVSTTSMLALQAVGGSAGNGICLNNIIAACAVVGLNIGEGAILKQTFKFVFGITTISTIVMVAFFARF
eukprot:Nitzschia sp. Nitz4//scaffold30_size153850//15442//17548//NITZ4_002759-RA/size153850-augustus-gene-0.66-mRNA-1//-1//CDS//3329547205//8686//frame0